MDVLKLVKDCVENYKLDSKVLRDIAFAICTSDKMNGTNQRELDIDKFVESDTELDWSEILSVLSISPVNKFGVKLPRVQKLRVISDVLSMSLSSNISGLNLMCKSSSKVAQKLGVSLPSLDYADEDICYENLAKIEEELTKVSLDLTELEDVYKRLCLYRDKVRVLDGFYIKDCILDMLIPDSIYNYSGKKCSVSELSNYLQKNKLTMNDYVAFIVDVYCYNIVQEIAKLLNARYSSNEVEFNLILTRLNSFAGNYLPVGTYSLNGYTQRLSVLRNVPSYLSRKVNVVFSESSSFSEMTILGCISVLYLIKKINIGKTEFTNEMEGLVNECRK